MIRRVDSIYVAHILTFDRAELLLRHVILKVIRSMRTVIGWFLNWFQGIPYTFIFILVGIRISILSLTLLCAKMATGLIIGISVGVLVGSFVTTYLIYALDQYLNGKPIRPFQGKSNGANCKSIIVNQFIILTRNQMLLSNRIHTNVRLPVRTWPWSHMLLMYSRVWWKIEDVK